MHENIEKYIPSGLTFFNSFLNKETLDKTYDSLEKIFKNYKKYDIPYSDQVENRGLTYLFTSDKVMMAYDALTKMKEIDPFLANVCMQIITVIYKKFGLKVTMKEALEKYITCVLLKYNPDFGIWLHIDNVARYSDEGPILGVSVGPSYSYMDFTPTLLFKENPEFIPLRVKIPQGTIYSMDGSSRMEWAHGLPYDTPYEKNKYTIMIKCNKLNSDGKKIHNKLLDTDIIESKIVES
jgi:alkylated DNA repair dioxygenase AlkB